MSSDTEGENGRQIDGSGDLEKYRSKILELEEILLGKQAVINKLQSEKDTVQVIHTFYFYLQSRLFLQHITTPDEHEKELKCQLEEVLKSRDELQNELNEADNLAQQVDLNKI